MSSRRTPKPRPSMHATLETRFSLSLRSLAISHKYRMRPPCPLQYRRLRSSSLDDRTRPNSSGIDKVRCLVKIRYALGSLRLCGMSHPPVSAHPQWHFPSSPTSSDPVTVAAKPSRGSVRREALDKARRNRRQHIAENQSPRGVSTLSQTMNDGSRNVLPRLQQDLNGCEQHFPSDAARRPSRTTDGCRTLRSSVRARP